MEHSPGPWKAYPHDCCPGNWYFVAGLLGLGKPDVHLDEANARLIAAAPDLLAALKMAFAMLKSVANSPAVLEPIAAAIAKARGAA